MFPKVNILWIPAILLSLLLSGAAGSCSAEKPGRSASPSAAGSAKSDQAGSVHSVASY